MKKILFRILRFSGLPFLLRETLQRNKVTILMFHDPTADTFLSCIRYLKEHYNIISLAQYIKSLHGKKPLPPKSVIITFDDGHKNNYKLLGTIKNYKVPVTIFLCSEIAGTSRHYWWTNFNDPDLLKLLKRTPEDEKRKLYKEYGFDFYKEFDPDDRQSLNNEEIREMFSTGLVDFQSHTRYHFVLDMCDYSLAKEEIEISKTSLESKYGKKIFAIAYPNGNYSSREVLLTQEAGYKCALTTMPGYNDMKTDPYELKRFGIPDNSKIDDIIIRTAGLWGYIKMILKPN